MQSNTPTSKRIYYQQNVDIQGKQKKKKKKFNHKDNCGDVSVLVEFLMPPTKMLLIPAPPFDPMSAESVV